ncbi:MAG: dynamin family protein [Bacteroidales bacterium]|nr:dynamin family protein [Bacteroidales bacterium]
MEICDKLISIANYLGLTQIEAELSAIDARQKEENPFLILPLVGEFSSGKTSLINALTDSRKLETATKPTTATIFEVHFGCDECRAKVLKENGEEDEYPEISELKNDHLADAKVVTVFDTSTKVPSTTILVDTPGLSSPDPKHKQTLVGFLPMADAILLVVDINQQMTRSLTDFIGTMKLSRKPIFLVLTKADTKAPSEIESAKRYLSENCEIPIQRIAVVSAIKDEMDELYELFGEIQTSKKDILTQADTQRLNGIAARLSEHIDGLMKASSSDKEMDEAIRNLQHELNCITRKIDSIIDSVSDDIVEKGRQITRKFEDTIQRKLNSLVGSGRSSNFDAEAISMINVTAALLLNEYKDSVKNVLQEAARTQGKSDSYIGLTLYADIDMDALNISGLSYNLDLNNMGHEYDQWIKTGLIAAAAFTVAVVAAPAAAGGAAVAGAEGGSLVAARVISDAKSRYQRYGQDIGSNKGIIDSIVGLATDKLMSKPQRVRAVRMYVESSLSPEFKSSLERISESIISDMREAISNEATNVIIQKEASLNQFKKERDEKKVSFNERMAQLKEFKSFLSTIN